MNPDSYRKRVLNNLALELKLPKLTFQVLRRTMAPLAQKKGTVKEVQGYLRHSRASTTTDVYMQQIPGTESALVEALSKELHKQVSQVTAAASNEIPSSPSKHRRSFTLIPLLAVLSCGLTLLYFLRRTPERRSCSSMNSSILLAR